MLSLLGQVKLSLRDDLVFVSSSINPHHHPRQHHAPSPSSGQSYDSPSSSSPASSNNDLPPSISRSAVTSGPPPLPSAHHINSLCKLRPLLAPQLPAAPMPSNCVNTAETPVHSPVALPGAAMTACSQQEEAADDSPLEDPSMKSFLGKIKAFEKMDHFARAQRMLEMQEAQNARVGTVQYSHSSSSVCIAHKRSQGLRSVLQDFTDCSLCICTGVSSSRCFDHNSQHSLHGI